jgi:hypothetical protein
MTPDKLINDGDRKAAEKYSHDILSIYYDESLKVHVYRSDSEAIESINTENNFEAGIVYTKQTYGTREQGIADMIKFIEDQDFETVSKDGLLSVLREKLKVNG